MPVRGNGGEDSATLRDVNGDPFPPDTVPGKYGILYTGDEAIVTSDPGGVSSEVARDKYRYVTIEVVKHAPKFDYPSLLGLKCQTQRICLRPAP